MCIILHQVASRSVTSPGQHKLSNFVKYAGSKQVDAAKDCFSGVLSVRPFGRPTCFSTTCREVSRWHVSIDHVRTFQTSRTASSLTPYRLAIRMTILIPHFESPTAHSSVRRARSLNKNHGQTAVQSVSLSAGGRNCRTRIWMF